MDDQQKNEQKTSKKCIQLIFVHQDLRNQPRNAPFILKHFSKSQIQIPQQLVFFPYNSDIQDKNWGCAWRAIQTYLSSRSIFMSFEKLFLKYHKKDYLLQIMIEGKLYETQIIQQAKHIKWAPEQSAHFWAQPFIGKLIIYDLLHQQHSLLLINGYPKANAPKIMFQTIISFNKFIQIIQRILIKNSIMIDDGLFALSIIGCKKQLDTVELFFADPHINSNKKCFQAGLYSVLFSNIGKQINFQCSQTNKEQHLFQVIKSLEFETKNWMVLCPSQ